MYIVPKSLEDLLLRYTKKTYLPDKRVNPKTADEFTIHDIKFFARGVAEMSGYFTSERGQLTKNYLNKKELRAGYILYFMMSNFLKVIFCLEAVSAKKRYNKTIKMADVGCGPGTASLACLEYFKDTDAQLEVTAVDQNSGALHDAKHLFQHYTNSGRASFKTVLSDLHFKNVSSALREKFDIIIMANFLSEMHDLSSQASFIKRAAKHLADNGIIIVVEPALRWTTRNLMKVRDMVLSHQTDGQRMVMLAPCLHNNSCPMLSGSHRDWCHMYLDWKRPGVIEKIDRLIGSYKDYLKFSYLILEPSHHLTIAPSYQSWRVVSAPMRSKGRVELLLCNSRGLNKVSLQDKNLSQPNADFERVKRGDLVEYDGTPEINKDSPFKICGQNF